MNFFEELHDILFVELHDILFVDLHDILFEEEERICKGG